ncbi:MAG TPA: adenylate/guanylate cyclase domain-containing protein [Polyangiaceae bacterium]|nr:adenylate/guanylate cyclase domain-containing protein [Polyangiaceae bacterium]
MRTVRTKLVALVLACVAPAVLGVVLRQRQAEKELLGQVERRVNGANRRLAAELDEYQANARLALTLTQHSARFQQALFARETGPVERMVKRLAAVYDQRIILAADAQGAILARGNADQGPKSLDPDASPAFGELLGGKPLTGMIPVSFSDAPGYALVSAEPVLVTELPTNNNPSSPAPPPAPVPGAKGARKPAVVAPPASASVPASTASAPTAPARPTAPMGTRVGSIVLLTRITEKYLGYLEPKLNSDLSIRVNGKLVASSPDNPGADLISMAEAPAFKEVGPKLFAVKTFLPPKLQRPGMEVSVTASRDVTELRDTARKALYQQLGWLGAVLVVVLGFALRFASRVGNAVRGISDAAEEVKVGKYVNAPTIRTGDELESLAEHFNAMVQGLKERDRLKETFGRYVTRQVAEHLMKGNLKLGGELVPVTVLFSDIRSFTAISERMEPPALLDFLNEYFSGMVESVLSHQGVVDKFIGDAIMAVFGAPVPQPDDALQAVKAALEMQRRLAKINENFRERGLPEIRTGIGLHSGQVVAGNMGHIERMEYTVIGDAVNLASRLESMTKELKCDVILSEDLYKQVEADVVAEPLQRIKVKGREQDVMVYRLVGLKSEAGA